MSLKIEDYAMIGDCQTAALVGRDGSIDWLCWPRFDSPSCFTRILGDEKNGRWLLAPRDTQAAVKRTYRDQTLILESHYETAEGAAVVIDFMPTELRPQAHLVRIVRGLRGTVRFYTELIIRPNYGVAIPWVRRDKADDLRAVVGPDALILRSGVTLAPGDMRHCAEFNVSAGESQSFVLSYHLSFEKPPEPIEAVSALKRTEERWRGWTGKNKFEGPYQGDVLRSLMALRALIYQPSGAIVAAPTTSLPSTLR